MTELPLPEESIFAQALEIKSAPERAAFLDRACGHNQGLRAEVEALLRAQDRSGDVLDLPEAGPADTLLPIREGPGTVIGLYKLMEQIGAGGMGLVFVAEQQRPVRRKVALKVIKPGMDTREVIARFEAERQALALMDHPNIAKVLDGGTTASGRPFFVMELVKGIPITQFCDESRLTTRERLELFVPVCQAVQHAHHKGIIHRDLKPSNVMVVSHDGTPVIKVIDFGVAKAVGQQLTEKTIYTQFTQLVGTPLYMSPEQAGQSGLDVDTRTDIYALGVLLYELLTGTTPFRKEQFHEAAYEEMRRIIREEEPPKPSTRISTLVGPAATNFSTQRKSDPKRLSQLFRGELDWIVMKCLEKDRNRRYETANGLAADVQRYLHDEPVQACPPSASYRLSKFARKYRTLLRAAAAFVVLLVLAAAVSTWQAVRATLAEKQALKDRDRAEASFRMARDSVDRFFTEVSQNPKLKAIGMERFRRDLVQNAKEFHERFIREHFETPGVRHDLGLAYLRLAEIERELANYPAAEKSATNAVTILGALAHAHPDTHDYRRDLAAVHVALGLVYSDSSRWDEAAAAYGRAVAIQEKQVSAHPESSQHRYALAKTLTRSAFTLLRSNNRADVAAIRLRQALEVLNAAREDRTPGLERQSLLAETQMNLGQVSLLKGQYGEAETALKESTRLYEELVRSRPDSGPEDWESLARSQTVLGRTYSLNSKHEKAEEVQQQALQAFEDLAREHPDVQAFAYDVGRCYQELGHTADRDGRPGPARARYDKAIKILEGASSKGYMKAREVAMTARIGRASTLAAEGKHARAAEDGEALAKRPNLTSINDYDIACLFSRSASAAERDPTLTHTDRARLKARYADRAMDFLRDAVAGGYGNPVAMRADIDLDPLRARDDFRTLIVGLEAQQKVSGAGQSDR
jgi:serine/threonine protein kinase/tetratricopeptide (TPR) repeat protein